MPVTKKSPAKKSPTKKTATKRTTRKAAPVATPAWNTIHIFGYGESQVIGDKANGKTPNGALKTLAPLMSYLASKQQKGTKISLDDTHALNIFNGSFVDFRPRGAKNKGQRFEWSEIDAKAINKFADELISKAPEEKPHGNFMARLMENRKPVIAKKNAPKAKKHLTSKAK